ncbi:outer membrane beta-barrel protein [Spirosoma sp. SC4-14]|uniref:outer membrane beta-barrel protein n=1 Tax=Spirosoma sp. SC4-14 TaxID=3128900 RepID=UPI0030D3AA8A
MHKPLFAFFLLVSTVVSAQNLSSFKVNLAAGYATPTERGNKDGSSPGFLYSIEPQYGFMNHFELGVRFEQAFIQRPEVLGNAIYFESQAKSTMSGVLTLNYVVGKSKAFRPYVGGGAGFYRIAQSEQQVIGASGTALYYPLPVTNKWGALVRAGVKVFRFNVEAAFNILEDTAVTNEITNAKLIAKNEYFSVKAGYTFGGN